MMNEIAVLLTFDEFELINELICEYVMYLTYDSKVKDEVDRKFSDELVKAYRR